MGGSESKATVLECMIKNLKKVKKAFIGPGLHLRPVCADGEWPSLQWTLNSVLSAYGNDNGRIRPPSGQGNLEEEKTDTNHPCLRTVSIGMEPQAYWLLTGWNVTAGLLIINCLITHE